MNKNNKQPQSKSKKDTKSAEKPNNSKVKKSQNEILKNKERFKMLFEKMNSGIIVVEIVYDKNANAIDGKIIDVNEAYWKQTGIEKRDVVGKNLNDEFPNYRKDLFQKLVHVAKTDEPLFAVEYIPQFDRHMNISAYSFKNNQYIAIFDDITDQVKAQEALLENEEKFHGLFKALNHGVIICNVLRKKGQKPEYFIEMVNPAFEKITGIKTKKISKKNLFEELNEFEIDIEEWLSTQKSKLAETDYFWKPRNKHLHLATFPIQQKQRVLIVQDITKEKNEFISRNHLASIVESSEDAIYSVSLNGSIISWNNGAENFYGYKADEVIGKNVNMLSLDEDKGEDIHKYLISQVRKGETVLNYELSQKDKFGKEIPVSLTKSPIINEEGEVIAISDVVKDMTKIKEREKNLILAKQKSEQASLLKTTFLQNISHEIRTPMNSIIGFTDILKREIKDSKNLKMMETIEESGQQLLRLIDDILDLSRLESGELSISKTKFNLDEILQHQKERFEAVRNSRGKNTLELKLILPENETPFFFYTDIHRFQQIIGNLLSNAIKYTESGSVEFGYEISKKNVLFFVKDTGKGIPQEHLNKIFERFERAGIDSEDVFSGTGLGLAISKGLTETLGGNIWCESEPGKGSNFFFTLPNELHEEVEEIPAELQNEDETTPPDLTGKTILIAEDDEFSFQMMQMMLEPTNVTIKYAADGEKAIDLFTENTIDLALLDIRLPKKNGFEIVKKIRETNPSIPVVAQSAYAMPDDKKKILENGFDAYLEKPLTSMRLYQTLRKYLLDNKKQN